MKPLPSPSSRKTRSAFSLVEVTLALGLVSFSLLAITGLLPMGLQMVSESSSQLGLAHINAQLRSELVKLSFDQINALDGQTRYYSEQGVKVGAEDAGRHFSATFSVLDPVTPGPAVTYAAHARNVRVTIRHPLSRPPEGQDRAILSFLAARQYSHP